MSILSKHYVIEMENGESWSIPVNVIAMDRAKYYAAKEFDGNVEKSLREDTEPCFEEDHFEIEDWAKNNMNWVDVKDSATRIDSSSFDYQDGWINGEAKIL